MAAPPQQPLTTEQMEAEWQEIQQAQRDPASFRHLYDRHFTPIFQFIHRRTSDEQTCADLTAQVFLKAMQQIGKFKNRGVPFSAWLYRIATNEVGMHYRKTRKTRVVSVDDHRLADMADAMDGDRYESFRPFLLPALQQLREEDMQLLELRFFEQRSFREIADIHHLSEAHARVKTHRVLDRLRKMLLRLAASEPVMAGALL